MSVKTEEWVEYSTQIRTKDSDDYVITTGSDQIRKYLIKLHNLYIGVRPNNGQEG